MPGKNLIKISSILFAISGVFGIVVYFLMGLLMGYGTQQTGESLGWVVTAMFGVYTVLSVLLLIAAVKGIKNCDSREAAPGLKKWGIFLIVLAVINVIVSVLGAANSDNSTMPASIISLVLPIFYYIGASKNEKA